MSSPPRPSPDISLQSFNPGLHPWRRGRRGLLPDFSQRKLTIKSACGLSPSPPQYSFGLRGPFLLLLPLYLLWKSLHPPTPTHTCTYMLTLAHTSTHTCLHMHTHTHTYTCAHTCESVKVLVAQLCLTLCDPMDCSLPGFSVHEILQARILEWVAIPFPRGSSEPRG